MIRYKEGVPDNTLQPVIVMALMILDSEISLITDDLIVTSTTDGQHNPKSLHYVGLAVDIRINHIRNYGIEKYFYLIRDTLRQISKCFDVVLEHDHIHIEFDRRNR